MLCPSIIKEFTDEDWQHNIQADYLISFLRFAHFLSGFWQLR